MGRVVMLVVALTAFALPLAAQVATPPPHTVGVDRLSSKVIMRSPLSRALDGVVIGPVAPLPWYRVLWNFAKEHPALLAPLVIGLLSLFGDTGDDLGALLVMGAAVALIVWGLASLWESRSSQWFVWIGSAVVVVVAFVVYKVAAASPLAIAIFELTLGAVGIPIAVRMAQGKTGLTLAVVLPLIGTAIGFARGFDKLKAALKPPAAGPAAGGAAKPDAVKAAEAARPPKRTRRKKAAPSV